MYGQGQFLQKRMNMNQINKLQRDLNDDDDDDYEPFTKAKVDDDNDKFIKKELDFNDMFKQKPSPQKEDLLKRQQTTPAKIQQTPKKDDKTPTTNQKPPGQKIEPPKPLQYKESLIIPPTPPPPHNKKVQETPKIEKQMEIKKDVSPKKTGFVVPTDSPKTDKLTRPGFVRKGKQDTISKVLSAYDIKNDRIRVIEPKNLKVVSRSLMLKESPTYYDTNNEVFEDLLFPANQSQLYQVPWRAKIDTNKLQFQRANNFYPNKPIETFISVDPNDVTPGEFMNNNLMTVLSLLAEKPYSIARLLEKQKVNQNGFYYVRLFIDGVWQFITVDDFFPNQRSGPSQDERLKSLSKNSFGYQTELWVSLIEKALSKVFGSYQDLEINQSSIKDLLWILTGAPSFDVKDKGEVQTALQNSPLAVVELNGCEHQGLQTLYGYSVLGFEKQAIKLRNPWGWPAKTNVKNIGPEGEFSLGFTEIGLYLKKMTVSQYRDEYWSVSHSVKQIANSYSVFELQLEKKSNCFITICQVNEKFFRNNLVDKYDYSFARILVFNSENELVNQKSGQEQYVGVELNLDIGIYKVIVCIDWVKQPFECTLSYYGSENCDLRRISLKNRLNLLSDLLAKRTINNGIKHTFQASNVNFNKNVIEYLYSDEENRILAVSWINQSKDQMIYKRDFKQVPYKTILKPLTLINPADEAKVARLSTKELNNVREKSWVECQNLELKLEAGQIYTVVFKSFDGRYDKDIFKSVGIL